MYRALNKAEKLPIFQRVIDEAVEAGEMTVAKGEEMMREFKRAIPDYGRPKSIKGFVACRCFFLPPVLSPHRDLFWIGTVTETVTANTIQEHL